jgi:hypothetical protein
MAWNTVGSGMSQGGTSSAGSSFISTLLVKTPFSYKILQNIEALNPKYEIFHDLASSRDEKLRKLSIAVPTSTDIAGGQIMVNKDYQQFMYANIDLDKIRRLQEYRRMAGYAQLADCLDEICDESIVKDENGKIVHFVFKGNYDKDIKEGINQEWEAIVNYFQLAERGWELFRNFLIDGELFFENIISQDKPDLGILGLMIIPPELINPIYDNIQNGIIRGYLLRKPKVDPQRTMTRQESEELVALQENQITYVSSGIWNEDKTIRLPFIENARIAFKQLSLIEDSIVIYRLNRAPERLVFNVDVGNMAPAKAEGYLKRLMQQFWQKRSFDTTTGRTTNVYDPLSMLDAYWFAKRAGTEGTKVDVLPGGHALNDLPDLYYFIKKLYRSLKVPVSRLDPNDPFKDGSEITREELRFAKFVMRIQKNFAEGIKKCFVTHLKLKGWWDKYKLQEHEFVFEFNPPSNFATMRQQQILELKFNNYNNICSNEGVANSFAQRYYMGFNDDQMAENRQWRREDAVFGWEIEQIRTNGPKWRELQAQAAAGEGGEAPPGGGGGRGGGGSFTPTTPPEFGGPAPTPGGAPGGAPGAGEAGVGGTKAPGAGAVGAKPAGSALPGTPPTG